MIPKRYFTSCLLLKAAKTTTLFLFLILLFSSKNLMAQCTVSAGHLSTPQIFISDEQIVLKADFQEAPTLTAGYFNWFVLAKGEDLVIEQLSTIAAFEVEKEGFFSIHSLAFSPEELDLKEIIFGETTVVDLAEMVLGVDGCSDFDFEGSDVELFGPTSLCGAYAGQLKADNAVCMDDSLAQISASEYLPAIVPDGFIQVFLLSTGDSSLITAVNEAPEFLVSQSDSFRIHSLVYDTASFKLDSLRFDSTTITQLNELLEQGEGDICASLDTTGVRLFPVNCLPECTAFAGSLISGEQDCLSDGTKAIHAQVDEPAVVPEGFLKTYLLTSGSDPVIRGMSNTPSFILEGEGAFTIHTLVYDSAFMSMDSVIVGQTKLEKLLGQLIQGGGDICGALDMEGASMELEDCPCEAQFGTLEPSDACLGERGAALEASVNTKAVVPENYQQLFILSFGDDLIVQEFSNEPYFEVEQAGRYRIHNLVYNPGSLPLGWIQFGQTSLNILNAFLIQGGGDICAALDVKGGLFVVEECQAELLSPKTYPNPVRDQLNVVLPENLDQKTIHVQLIDGLGNIRQTLEVDQPLEQINFDVSGLPEGWYSLRILYGTGRVGVSKVYISGS